MTIVMSCDRCDERVDPDVNGGVRVKLGVTEIVFHLCFECQEQLRHDLQPFHNGKAAVKKGAL